MFQNFLHNCVRHTGKYWFDAISMLVGKRRILYWADHFAACSLLLSWPLYEVGLQCLSSERLSWTWWSQSSSFSGKPCFCSLKDSQFEGIPFKFFLQSKGSSGAVVCLDLTFQPLDQPGLWVSQRTWETSAESGTWPCHASEPSSSLWNPESHGLPGTGGVSLQGWTAALKMWIVDNVPGDSTGQIKNILSEAVWEWLWPWRGENRNRIYETVLSQTTS